MSAGRLFPIGCVVLAAALWATTGISYDLILDHGGTTPLTVVTIRAVVAGVAVWGWIALRQPAAARVDRSDLPGLAGLGLVAITLFYVALIYAFRWTSVSIGTILLYLAPVLVTIGSWGLYHEALTRRQVGAMAMALAGCFLAAGALDPGGQHASRGGVALGLLSAAAYGSYSLFGKRFLVRYGGPTVLAYTFLFGGSALLAVKLAAEPTSWPPLGTVAAIALWNGLLTTLLPLVLYTVGLKRLPAGIASTAATVEPVVAVALAALVLGEPVSAAKVVGGALVLSAVAVLARSSRAENADAPADPAGASLPIEVSAG